MKSPLSDNEISIEDEVRMIGKFMDLMVFDNFAQVQAFPIDKLQPYILLDDGGLEFFFKWGNLIPVVEKIRSNESVIAVEISFSLGTICKICFRNREKLNFEWLTIEDNNSIEAVYKAVVEFIKFYNDSKKV